MNTNERTCSIVRGPSRETICLSVLYVHDKDKGIPITFRVLKGSDPENGYVKMRDVRICSFAHEDESGYKFILTGTCEAEIAEGDFTVCSFKACYDAKTRDGDFTFIW